VFCPGGSIGSTFFAVAAVEALVVFLVVFGGLSSEGLSVDAVSFDDAKVELAAVVAVFTEVGARTGRAGILPR